MNRVDCKKQTHERVEESQLIINSAINSTIFQIADSAYCNGYNYVLDAAIKVLDGETYNKLIEELDKMNRKEETK